MFKNIRLISFDLDDTLWPTRPVIMAAEKQLYDWLIQNAPALTRSLSIFDMRDQRLQFMREHPQLAHNLTLVRRKTLEMALQKHGYPQVLAEQAVHVFRTARNQVTPWDDVMPVLYALRQRYTLVSMTNGNAQIEHTPLSGCFHYSLSAEDVGAAKPDYAMFQQLVSRSGYSFQQMLHVGDDGERDIVPARSLGMATAWVHRAAAVNGYGRGADLCLFNLKPLLVYL